MKISALQHRRIVSPLEPDTHSSFLKWMLETKTCILWKMPSALNHIAIPQPKQNSM